MFQLPSLNEPAELASVKCPHCKEVTPTQWVRVSPEWLGVDNPCEDIETSNTPDPMDLLKLTKRLSLCTNCGNMRLTN